MSRRAALTGALLITLASPATWPMALAAFLIRGGLLLIVLPIVVLPSPVGLGNLLAPALIDLVLRGVSVEVALIIGTIGLALVAWIVVGGLVAAWLEAEVVRVVARDEDVDGDGGSDRPAAGDAALARGEAWRVLAVRLVAHIPTGLAVGWGSARLVAIVYRELTSPFDVATPILLRVLRSAPEVVVAIVMTWMLGEIVGALAARRVSLGGAGVIRALGDAALTVLRHPLSVLVRFWFPAAVLVLVLAPSTLAAAAAWGTVRVALRSSGDPVGAGVTVVLFVALWIVGLVLIGVTSAWRVTVWSVAHGELVDGRRDRQERLSG